MKIDECELEMKLNLRKRNLIEKKREWMRMEGIFSKIIYNRFKFYKYQTNTIIQMLYLLDVNQSERLAIIKVCCSFLASSKVLIDLTCQVVRKCHQFKTGDSLGNWIVEHERPNFVTDCIPVSTKLRPLMKLANSIPGFSINLENIFSGIISMKTVSML